jgi:hypothetical protein
MLHLLSRIPCVRDTAFQAVSQLSLMEELHTDSIDGGHEASYIG